MHKRIMIISFFLNISSLFASAPISQNSRKLSAFTKIDHQSPAISKLEEEVSRLNSENIELKNNIEFLRNFVFALTIAQNNLLHLVKNNIDQHSNEETISTSQNTPANAGGNTNSSSTNSFNTQRPPVIRRSSITSTNNNLA